MNNKSLFPNFSELKNWISNLDEPQKFLFWIIVAIFLWHFILYPIFWSLMGYEVWWEDFHWSRMKWLEEDTWAR